LRASRVSRRAFASDQSSCIHVKQKDKLTRLYIAAKKKRKPKKKANGKATTAAEAQETNGINKDGTGDVDEEDEEDEGTNSPIVRNADEGRRSDDRHAHIVRRKAPYPATFAMRIPSICHLPLPNRHRP